MPDDIITKLRALRGLASARTIAALLDLKVSTVYKLVRLHQIPSFRIGYAVRFDPVAVAAWLHARQINPE